MCQAVAAWCTTPGCKPFMPRRTSSQCVSARLSLHVPGCPCVCQAVPACARLSQHLPCCSCLVHHPRLQALHAKENIFSVGVCQAVSACARLSLPDAPSQAAGPLCQAELFLCACLPGCSSSLGLHLVRVWGSRLAWLTLSAWFLLLLTVH